MQADGSSFPVFILGRTIGGSTRASRAVSSALAGNNGNPCIRFCFWLSAEKEAMIRQRFKMNLREISGAIEKELTSLFEELRSGMAAREDSRAFGAMIERRILDNWAGICQRCGFTPVDLPGRRTIFDFGFTVENQIVGIDVKTKDLDSTKYSDGGICAVGNLLKFLANDKGQFIIAEFGHNQSSTTKDARDSRIYPSCPIHSPS